MTSRFRSFLLIAASAALITGCGGVSKKGNPGTVGPQPAGITAVNHVVILLQENRSFDHYFGQMTAYRQANGIPINGSPATIDDESASVFQCLPRHRSRH